SACCAAHSPTLVTIDPATAAVSTIGATVDGLRALAWDLAAPPNTPMGSPTVTLDHATVAFQNVTQAGTTTIAINAVGPQLPAGCSIGTPSTFLDIHTTAAFAGSVQVCRSYAGIAFGNEANLKLLHFDGSLYADVTTSLDTSANVICGLTTSLSPFVVAEQEV